MYAIGLMSGTSLDGVDAVLCKVEGTGQHTAIEQVEFDTYVLPESVKACVLKCASNTASPAEICSLNFELGSVFGKAALEITKKAGLIPEEIAFIASHGQTIYHIPFATDAYTASTMQLGEPSVIAQMTQIPVISNFRSADMAVGGQGAPLVPYSEWVLYSRPGENIALQNIGGIGNVTLIPGSGNPEEIFAFDTGPGNMMIDEAMKELYSKSYDANGAVAASGNIIPALAQELADHPYLKLAPPKSTGREVFGKPMVQDILARYQFEKPQDLVATLTWFTAYSIAKSYQDAILSRMDLHEIILGGGGAHNQTLKQMLQNMLPDIPVKTQEEKGYSSDAKEAIAFVILGNQTWHHLPSNVPKATGASRQVILGSISWPY